MKCILILLKRIIDFFQRFWAYKSSIADAIKTEVETEVVSTQNKLK